MAITLPTYESDSRGLGNEARYGAVSPQSIHAGDAVPDALSGLGQTVQKIGVEHLQQIKQLQSADYLENGYGGLVSDTIDGAEQAKADFPDGKGYKEHVVGQFQAGLDTLVKNAPSPQAARQIQQRATRFRQSLETRSRGYEDQASRQAAILNQSQVANSLINAAGNAPETIHEVRQTLTDTVNNNPAFHPQDKKALLEHLLPLAGEAAARGAIEANRDAPYGQRGYDQFLADAKAGKWNDLLSPEGMQSAKGYANGMSRQDLAAQEAEQKAEAIERRREASQAKAQAAQQTMLDRQESRAQLYGRIAGDATTGTPGLFDAVAQGAKLDPSDIPSEKEWLKAYPGASGKETYLKFRNKLADAQESAKLYDMPEPDLEAAVAGKAPAVAGAPPDTTGTAEPSAVDKIKPAMAHKVLAERRADPVMASMSRDPGVAQAAQASQADPENLGKLQAAIGATVSWQARMGMAPKDYAAFTKPRMEVIAKSLNDEKATPQQQVQTLKGMLAAIDGAHYPDDGVKDALKRNFFDGLKKAGVPGVEAAEPLIRQDAPDSLVTKVLSNERVQAKPSDTDRADLKPKLDDALQDWEHAGALVSNWTGDATHAGAVGNLRERVTNYGGNFGKDKVGEGVDAYTAGMQPVYSETLAAGMVPRGVDTNAVKAGLETIRGDLGTYLPKDHVLGIIDPRGQGGGLLSWKADRFLAGGADVRFHLKPDGAHLLVPTGGGGMAEAYGSDKRPVVIPYDKVVSVKASAANPAAPDGGEAVAPTPAPATGPFSKLIRNVPDDTVMGGSR